MYSVIASNTVASPARTRNLLLLIALVTCWGCGDDSPHDRVDVDASVRMTEWVGVQESQPSATPIAPHTECTVTTAREEPTSAAHVDPCTPLAYPLFPPSTGTHYARWADFRAYDEPIPYGFLVHALEHGAIALLYKCDGACPDLVASLQSIIDDFGPDRRCETNGVNARFILMPDPNLDVPVAAVAWGNVYRATCFDQASLERFVTEHYGNAPEDLCAAGVAAESFCD